ncbi:MAG: NAD(P)/FAD-dependent oxidoreductase [Paracoccaceae bacterium]
MKADALVLGAGMVGIATALHLIDRGRSVALVDRRGPAGETSYGNAGLIQSEAVMPYAFPRDPGAILAVLAGRATAARIAPDALPATARWLLAYARHSGPAAVERTARANLPLVSRALAEHRALMARAGATAALRPGGYLRLHRHARTLERALRAEEAVRARFGVAFEAWDADRLAREEPHLSSGLAGAIHHPEPARVDDPGDVGRAYARLFERDGGTIVEGAALGLTREGSAWRLDTRTGAIRARDAVVALGPWSGDLLRRFGVRLPLGVKRGYHMHYGARGNAVLHRLAVDEDHGYVLAPQRRGIRLTTGAEFARRDDPPSPVQLARAEATARGLFPIEDRLDVAPWLGARPCLPDLLPVIGAVPGQSRLWVNTGHHHLGFTLGPVTGRLLAEMMTGAEPFADPAPYGAARFAGARAR